MGTHCSMYSERDAAVLVCFVLELLYGGDVRRGQTTHKRDGFECWQDLDEEGITIQIEGSVRYLDSYDKLYTDTGWGPLGIVQEAHLGLTKAPRELSSVRE